MFLDHIGRELHIVRGLADTTADHRSALPQGRVVARPIDLLKAREPLYPIIRKLTN